MSLDLGSNLQCGSTSQQIGSTRPMGFFYGDVDLPDYIHLGNGDCRDITVDQKLIDAWKSATGYKPSGDRLVDLLKKETGTKAEMPALADHPISQSKDQKK